MDVADDAIYRDSGPSNWKIVKLEIDLLSVIENAPVQPKVRCKLVRQVIEGAPHSMIEEEIDKEAKIEPT